jgi:uncharacterized protein YacL
MSQTSRDSQTGQLIRQRTVMRVSLNFIVRIIGMLALSYVGLTIGQTFSGPSPSEADLLATQLLALAGAGLGLLTTPLWTIEPVREGLRYIRTISISELTALLFGALVGLVFSVLISIPLSHLPSPFGQTLPIIGTIVLSYLGAIIFSNRRRDFGDLLRSTRTSPMGLPTFSNKPPRRFLVDTSAIIDGRIALVSQTGFLDGTLLVPHFVLNELQMLADSSDELRRGRGKRGLEILNGMQKQADLPVEVIHTEVPGVAQVDDRLVALALQYRCPVITNDHNLGRVAELQGVKVLNLNQLADAIRPPVIPGQDLVVRIRDIGRERDQGISFMEDGTMIVIEEAKKLVGQEVSVNVSRVFQTQTGRIVFAQLNSPEGETVGK